MSSDKQTPVTFGDFHQNVNLDEAETWSVPDFSGQENFLGYSSAAFGVPAGMEERVSFWLDIYTKYTTDQGLLHDSRYVHITYEAVDFTEIMKTENLDKKSISKLRRQHMDAAKDKIRARLRRLNALTSPAGLEGEDLRYWYMFANINEENKFSEAAKDGRLRFQLGQKDRFIEGIYHSGRYLKQMESIFKEMQLPMELTRLPFVESSFNLNARSKVGASGIWQFMRATGKQYMRLDDVVDERNDPLLATEAAAKKLRSNFQMLGNWPLAVTAYNHGPYGLKRLVNKYNTDNLVELVDIRKGRFGFASASFYASFLAALEAEKRAEKYFGVVFREKPLLVQKIKINKMISKLNIIDLFNGDKNKAEKYNPHIRSHFWNGNKYLKNGNFIFVPQNDYEQYLTRFRAIELKDNKKVATEKTSEGTYRISSGETLSQIAINFNVKLQTLMEANGIDNPRRIQVGQRLIIPE